MKKKIMGKILFKYDWKQVVWPKITLIVNCMYVYIHAPNILYKEKRIGSVFFYASATFKLNTM